MPRKPPGASQGVLTSCLYFPRWLGHTEGWQYWQTLYEMSIMTHKANKRLNFGISVWGGRSAMASKFFLEGRTPFLLT